jgi:hypothetical protein
MTFTRPKCFRQPRPDLRKHGTAPREAGYVGLSCGRRENHVYATSAEVSAGPECATSQWTIPRLVAQWCAEVRAQRLQAEQQLRPMHEEEQLAEAEIHQLVASMRDVVKTLKRADAEQSRRLPRAWAEIDLQPR